MKTNNTFANMFLCRPNKKDNKEGLIYVRITVNGNQTEVSLKEKIMTVQWNVLKQQLNGRTIQIKAINTYIDDVRFKLKEKYREMETKDITITAQSIKDIFLGKSVKDLIDV